MDKAFIKGAKAISAVMAMMMLGTSLYGCTGSKEAAKNSEGTAAGKPVEIKYWVPMN